jgi:hypothetical protein
VNDAATGAVYYRAWSAAARALPAAAPAPAPARRSLALLPQFATCPACVGDPSSNAASRRVWCTLAAACVDALANTGDASPTCGASGSDTVSLGSFYSGLSVPNAVPCSAGAPPPLSLVVAFTVAAPPGGSPPGGLAAAVAAPAFSAALGSSLAAAGFPGAAVGSVAASLSAAAPREAGASAEPPLGLLGLAALLALGPLAWWLCYKRRRGGCCAGGGAAGPRGGDPVAKGDAAAVTVAAGAASERAPVTPGDFEKAPPGAPSLQLRDAQLVNGDVSERRGGAPRFSEHSASSSPQTIPSPAPPPRPLAPPATLGIYADFQTATAPL